MYILRRPEKIVPLWFSGCGARLWSVFQTIKLPGVEQLYDVVNTYSCPFHSVRDSVTHQTT